MTVVSPLPSSTVTFTATPSSLSISATTREQSPSSGLHRDKFNPPEASAVSDLSFETGGFAGAEVPSYKRHNHPCDTGICPGRLCIHNFSSVGVFHEHTSAVHHEQARIRREIFPANPVRSGESHSPGAHEVLRQHIGRFPLDEVKGHRRRRCEVRRILGICIDTQEYTDNPYQALIYQKRAAIQTHNHGHFTHRDTQSSGNQRTARHNQKYPDPLRHRHGFAENQKGGKQTEEVAQATEGIGDAERIVTQDVEP